MNNVLRGGLLIISTLLILLIYINVSQQRDFASQLATTNAELENLKTELRSLKMNLQQMPKASSTGQGQNLSSEKRLKNEIQKIALEISTLLDLDKSQKAKFWELSTSFANQAYEIQYGGNYKTIADRRRAIDEATNALDKKVATIVGKDDFAAYMKYIQRYRQK